ncbi:non-ribosomal peptide synthetase [Streptomyces sp. NPDC019990]|uniref:non-ribosomal peptide synthetase n=1 Tax=Streptomyces sp. NPDC019990 TaxID=3154693 RepID=UPI0033CC4C48
MTSEHVSVADALFLAVERHPDRVAIETADGSVTYRELGWRVSEFASELATLSSPGEFIGIEAVRTPASVIAMAAALRAERPFVFLDPRDSAASNHAKVSSLAVEWIAETSAGADSPVLVPTPAQWRTTAENRPEPTGTPIVPPQDRVGYAIHTSGSTGEPKCVLVSADPLAGVIEDHVRALELGPECRTLQFARLTFDGCLTEILWTLTAGACLVVLGEENLSPGAVLQATLEKYRVTHLKTTPYALTATDPTPAMSLRHVLNGGGACRPAVVRKWSSHAHFHNAYGTTESTVCNLLSAPLDPGDCTDAVPLGTVVGDCGLEVVPLPGAGAGDAPATGSGPTRGELVITGTSVAIGYLTSRGLRRFVDDAADRVYRTGDIVEVRDGQYYFVERLDRQLKVRGYRLDPGEIESAACRLETVVEAVVDAEAYDGEDTSAADALVCHYQGEATPRELRAHLEAVLDPYKVPSVLHRVDALPYTRNGKVDRDALRTDRQRAGTAEPGAGPREQILALVRHLTGVDDAGEEDSFFDLGGDSASTVILVSKLKALGWMDAGVRDVLRAENLRTLIDRVPTGEV